MKNIPGKKIGILALVIALTLPGALASCNSSNTPALGPFLYAADGNRAYAGFLYRIYPLTKTIQIVGEIGVPVQGLAMSEDGTLYGVTGGSYSSVENNLITINHFDGSVEDTVGALGQLIKGIVFVGTTLFGFSIDDGDLVTINTTSGAASSLAGPGASTISGNGLTYDSGNEMLLHAGINDDELSSLDQSTGAATNVADLERDGDTALVGDGDSVGSLAYMNGMIYAVLSSDDSETPRQLATIDAETGEVSAVMAIPSGISSIAAP